MTVEPLAGYSIAVTAARRRRELGAALERRGACVLYAPAIRIVPLEDDSELRKATDRCLNGPLDIVVATTGIGFRGWMDAAEAWGLAGPLTDALGAATILARGPKVQGAIRATGLREDWAPKSESSSEVLAHLIESGDLERKRIAVQLHGEPLPDVVDTLRLSGAEVIEVPVYRWIAPEDPAPLERLVELVVARSVDAVSFTSAPAAISFLDTADRLGVGKELREAMRHDVVAAAVGPVTSSPLEREDIPVIQPQRARLGALVHTLVGELPKLRGRELTAAGHALDIRGSAVVVDRELISVSAAGMVLLRALTARPGEVVSRATMLDLLPGCGSDEHAVEVAVGRLRSALGDPRIVQTVVKRGYRLAYEPEAGSRASWRY